jgi:DNA-binding GntR family transcriptional regulator
MATEDGRGAGTSGSLPRVVPRTYRADVYAGLRHAILDGTLAPGAPLVERRISEEMGVSRAPVREALRKLEEDGLVVTIPYKGTYVTRVTPEVMDEILSLRTVLEVYAALRALPRLEPAGLERLRALVDDMEQAGEHDEPERLDELHTQFHRALYEQAGSGLLLQFWGMMETQLHLYSRVHQRAYESLREYAAAHRVLVQALEWGNPELVRERVLAHLGAKTDVLLRRPR